ncbi:MAG: 2-dehydro-3-deoxygluconokinase [Paracoccaceae bacterium]|jgi:2-dehydro-3-deoxygluconokinase
MPAIKIACIGEAMVELAMDRDRQDIAHVGVAGDTLNTAIYLKRCAPELQVSYITRLGQDAFSDRIIAFMQGEDIDTSRVGFSDRRTPGLYSITTDAAGERTFAYWRDSSAAREMFDGSDPELSALGDFDVVYLSAITLAILSPDARARLMAWIPDYRQSGGRIVFDSNYRPLLWADADTARTAIAAMWRCTDIALPSVDDEQLAFGDVDSDAVVARILSYGVRNGALKRGASGPVSFAGAEPQEFAAAGTVVDSTAAGDSFNGGYLAAYLQGQDEGACLQAGHNLAVRVLGVKGAIIPKD